MAIFIATAINQVRSSPFTGDCFSSSINTSYMYLSLFLLRTYEILTCHSLRLQTLKQAFASRL